MRTLRWGSHGCIWWRVWRSAAAAVAAIVCSVLTLPCCGAWPIFNMQRLCIEAHELVSAIDGLGKGVQVRLPVGWHANPTSSSRCTDCRATLGPVMSANNPLPFTLDAGSLFCVHVCQGGGKFKRKIQSEIKFLNDAVSGKIKVKKEHVSWPTSSPCRSTARCTVASCGGGGCHAHERETPSQCPQTPV